LRTIFASLSLKGYRRSRSQAYCLGSSNAATIWLGKISV